MFRRIKRDGIAVRTVPSLLSSFGMCVAFSERSGGVSEGPYASLNLAAHVGDSPRAVDENCRRLLAVLGVHDLRGSLTTAEQVHGTSCQEITLENAGSGAFADRAQNGMTRLPVEQSDMLWTRTRGVPLLLMYADCVPIVLVRPSVPAIAVVHAGWRGAAAGIVSKAVRTLAALPGKDDMIALVGPHIGPCCYDVGNECLSHFGKTFATISSEAPRLDLGAVVADDLARSGIPRGRQWHLGVAQHTTQKSGIRIAPKG